MMHESSLKSSPSSSNTYSDEQIHEQKDGTIVPLWNFHNTLSKTPMNKDFQDNFLADASAGARIRPRDINVLIACEESQARMKKSIKYNITSKTSDYENDNEVRNYRYGHRNG